MTVPNIFNVHFDTATAGDNEVIPAYGPSKKNRVMQLAVQNLDPTVSTRIEVKVSGDIIVGPVLLSAGALVSFELPAWEDKPYFYLPDNTPLVINSSEAVELTAFGYADVVGK